MKAEINKYGVLIVKSENELEQDDLNKWAENNIINEIKLNISLIPNTIENGK